MRGLKTRMNGGAFVCPQEFAVPVRALRHGSRGNCWLSVKRDSGSDSAHRGDCFLLAPASTYALRDNPRTRARSFCEAAPKNRSNVIHYGGGGSRHGNLGMVQLWPDERQAPKTSASRVDSGQADQAKPSHSTQLCSCSHRKWQNQRLLGSNGQPASGYFVHPVCRPT